MTRRILSRVTPGESSYALKQMRQEANRRARTHPRLKSAAYIPLPRNGIFSGNLLRHMQAMLLSIMYIQNFFDVDNWLSNNKLLYWVVRLSSQRKRKASHRRTMSLYVKVSNNSPVRILWVSGQRIWIACVIVGM